MDSGRSTVFSGGLKLNTESAINESGILGTRRGFGNIRWYEYTFLLLGVLATVVTDGLTIARLFTLFPRQDPEVAYGILLLVHSIFLLLFLITGIFYQRITDIVAFFVSTVLLTIYVVAHYVARNASPDSSGNTQKELRLTRLIFTIVFNVCFIPLAFVVIKDYRRDEFSKRLFGAYSAERRPLQIYSIFDCVVRLNTMLSISSLLLNLYNITNSETPDIVLICLGIPIALLWLVVGIGMARLEKVILVFVFYFLSLFQLGFLGFSLYTTIKHSIETSRTTVTSIIPTQTTSMISSTTTTTVPTNNLVPILHVLYVCIIVNLLTHIISMILGFWCSRNFNQNLKERVFNTKIDKWLQQRW